MRKRLNYETLENCWSCKNSIWVDNTVTCKFGKVGFSAFLLSVNCKEREKMSFEEYQKRGERDGI